MEELSDFEKSILGDSPATITQAPIEEPKEAWETMTLKEARKYYKIQLAERRTRERSFLEQRKRCKEIREYIKKYIDKIHQEDFDSEKASAEGE